MDEAEVREFLRADYPRLVAGLALAYGGWSVAEDWVQEALARAWERSERGERFESLVAWVAVVATNLARSGLRRRKTEGEVQRELAGRLGDRGQGSDASGPSGSAGALDRALDIRRAIRKLPRRQRQVTVLHYYLGLEIKTIAAQLGIEEGTVKKALFRSRRAIGESLGEPTSEDKEGEEHAPV